jgi:AraC-like DNA-binding protein
MYSYTVILMVPILILCGVMFRQIQQQNSLKARQDSLNKAQMIAVHMDGKFSEMNAMGDRLSASSWVKRAQSNFDLITKELDYLRKKEISDELSVYNATIRVTRDIALMLPEKRMVINQVSWWEDDRYLFSIDFRDKQQEAELLAKLRQPSFFKLIAVDGKGTDIENNFFLVRSLGFSDNPLAVLLFYVNGESLRQYIMENQGDSLVSLRLLQDGESIFSIQSSKEHKQESYTELISSEIFPWAYEMEINSPVENGLNEVLFIIVALFSSLLVGGVAAYYLAKTSFRPIWRLLSKIGAGNDSDMHEFLVIEQSFDRLHDENQELKQLSEHYYNGGRNNLLANLLWGYFNPDLIYVDIARFNVPFQETMMYEVVILVQTDSHKVEGSGLKYYIELQEYLKNLIDTVELIEVANGDIVAILYVEQEDEDRLVFIAEQLYREFQVDEHSKLICGTPECGLVGVSKSYQNAKELISSPVNPITTLNVTEKRYYYPIDWEIQLINQLKVGNLKVVRQIMMELQKENLERHLPTEEATRVTSLIFETFVRIMEDTDLNILQSREEFEMIQQSNDAVWPWNYLLAFAQLICSRLEYFNLESTKDTGLEILAYVEQNYCNSSLSLQKIAEIHGLSVSAISKIFKSTVKVNFSDYLQLLRVQRAKEYFAMGEMDVAKVAAKVGYDNEITFKRAFQKSEFLTPRKYIQQIARSH